MTEATQTADDGSELRINDDVSDVTDLEAHRIFENTAYNVTVNPATAGSERARITVFWSSDMDRVNGYHKASVVNDVLACPASVELHSTDEGSHSVTFIAR